MSASKSRDLFRTNTLLSCAPLQRKLELLEVERIRRIKATEEKYLRQTHDKYGELKKRRSQAYQSEKEISKYKRDYAVAKQK